MRKSSDRKATQRWNNAPKGDINISLNEGVPHSVGFDFNDSPMERTESAESQSDFNTRLSVQGVPEMRPSASDAMHNINDLNFKPRKQGFSAGSRLSTFSRSGRRGTLSMAQRLKSVSTLLTNDELLMDVDQQVDCVENLKDLLESQKILTRLQSNGDYMKRLPTKRSSSNGDYMKRKSIITPEHKRELQNELTQGERLTDVDRMYPKDIKHPEAINYWREFEEIKFWKSPTVSKVIRQILQTNIPEIGVSYQMIIDEFLHQDWPINIFLHGGLMRDIMTSTIGNDVDIAFTCPHREMKRICDKKKWPCTIREDIPYWVIGGESNFETKLEGFPLSFNGLSRFHIADFACNTIYYDCKNEILIDRYGRGVDAALEKKLTLPIFQWEDRHKWRDTDFIPGVKMYRFFKFVTRGFDYDKQAAEFIQSSLMEYVEVDQAGAESSCFHALRHLARGQDSKSAAMNYKSKLKKSVQELFLDIGAPNATKAEASTYWERSWEGIVNSVINQGQFETERNVERAMKVWDSEADFGIEESDYDQMVGTRVGGDSIDTPRASRKSGLGTEKSLSAIE